MSGREASDRLVWDGAGGLARLVEIMARLRAPDGCPWDRAQSFASIAPYTIEEAHEVADAIAKGDLRELRDELGDLLLQVVYHARMAEEVGAFALEDVIDAISAKMLRRHPHVFGDGPGEPRADPALFDWEALKAAERAARGEVRTSALDGVPSMPALARAQRLTERAASVGFDWPNAAEVLAKLAEEAGELAAELPEADPDRIEDEYGDLLFVMANLARHLKLDAEGALRRANAKFERRFREVERRLAVRGLAPGSASLAEMEAIWGEVKRDERGGGAD